MQGHAMGGTPDTPRPSFGKVLATTARFNPRGIAVTCGAERITWRDLNIRVNRLANALKACGVKKGDHASLLFHDCPEFIEANYALQKLGAVPVPVNFRFVAREIEYQLTQSDSTILIFEDLYLDETRKALAATPKIRTVVCCTREGRSAPAGMIDYAALIRTGSANEPPACTTEHDVCTICYTGGTTGLPKGVVLTYANFWNLAASLFGDLLGRLASDTKVNFGRIVSRIFPVPGLEKGLNRLMGFSPVRSFLSDSLPKLVSATAGTALGPLLGRVTGGISIFMNMPLFHMANYQLLIIGPMSGLVRFILREGIHFDPEEVLGTIERERPMVLLLVPTQWNMVLDHPGIAGHDRSSILVAMTGAGVNPAHRKKQILEQFPNSLVVDVFGQTEMTPDTALRIDAAPETLKNKSVGRPLSGIEMRIVDEQGRDVSAGEVGEILYKSGTVMKGYYGEEDKTREVIRDGWFHSGDLGYIDTDGEIIVVDRKNECISTGAEKVFPHEVEEILARHEKVDAACVIGVPDATWGNAVQAVVVLKPGASATADEIMAWCRDKMTGFKRPRHVVFAEALPLSPVGKVLRKQVRELYGKSTEM